MNTVITQAPRSDILQNVFAISPDQKTYGSCFLYPSGGFMCLITASHVIKTLSHAEEGQRLSIYQNNEWRELIVAPYFASEHSYVDGSNDIDIAVIKTSIPIDSKPWVELSSVGVILGQDVHFLGFPYFQNSIRYNSETLNREAPFPLVKKATISSLPQSNQPFFYLDGHNNLGFSGGPVTFWDSATNKQKVIGIISSYLTHNGEIKPVETLSSQLLYQENSGIAVAYNIQYAQDIIDKFIV